ncbi:hypothetical protein W97_08699 [Coniosporium apollinis CBS 100218]|uniref:Uncharacterized protein n=1 Tax=Coniosporium apollinis (strain CBS 100218) TaxID=1168221 RepID=R7Z5Z0_CONA1|nr:uncharacterized protein W97_08699 [Coniosporium apollinis CBS 100218]EON69439.1 hypothetical protein W97_08699 [Coniosporium apollinis CBS 100218]
MATAVGQALTQQLWTDLKRKATDIKTIDSMFSITKDPTAFFNKSLLLHTKLIALLAAVAWLLPILAVVTPATLSVTLQNVTTIQTLNVPDVNWNASAFMDVFGREGDFTLVSVQVKRAITISAYSVEILAITPLFPDYSYSLNFFGPSFRCQDVNAPGEQALFESIRPSNYNQTIQNVLNNNGTPFMDTWDFAMDLLYVGIIPFPSAYNSILLLTPDVNISCTLWNTSYDVIFDLSQGAQTIHESKVIPQEPYRYDDIDDDFTYGMVGSMGFEAVAGSMASILKGHIEVADSMWPHFGAGGSNADFTNNTGVWDPIYHTGLIFCPELGEHIVQINIDDPSSMPQTLTATMPRWMCRAGSLARAVEELSRNITYSLFTVPDVVEERPIHANIRSARNEYSYRSRYLLLSYGIGILFTISGIAIGGFAYHSNGYSASTSFSTILLTTRKNPNLDELSEGQCLGKQPLAEEIGRIKLRFGVLSPAGSSGVEIGHAGFGLMGDTRRLRKYEYLR